jgi:hypothetical protein
MGKYWIYCEQHTIAEQLSIKTKAVLGAISLESLSVMQASNSTTFCECDAEWTLGSRLPQCDEPSVPCDTDKT